MAVVIYDEVKNLFNKNLLKNLFNNSINEGKEHLISFNGATINRLDHFITPISEEDRPDIVIIHADSNDITHTTDKFWLNNSLAINFTILRFAYRKMDVQKRTCTNFWYFCCSYHQIIAV